MAKGLAICCGVLLTLAFLCPGALGDWIFSLKITRFVNGDGRLANGNGCTTWIFSSGCDIYFTTCLGATLANVLAGPPVCNVAGSRTSSQWDSQKTFNPNYLFTFPVVSGAWPGSIGIRLDAYDQNSIGGDGTVQLTGWFESFTVGAGARAFSGSFSNVEFFLEGTVVCATNYYTSNCNVYCLANANYVCDSNGNKVCRSGRTNPASDCVTACPIGYQCLNGVTSICTAGATFQSQTGQSSCVSTTPCLSTHYQTVPATISTDRTCTACTVRSACGVGTALTGTCSGPNSPASNPSCVACDGTNAFQNEAGQASCKSTTVCTALQFEATAPSSLRNRVCSTCRTASNCTAGTALSGACSGASVPASNPTCAACDGITGFQNLAGQTVCRAVTVCTATQFQLTAPTATTNRVCGNCTLASACGVGSSLRGACSGPNVPATNTSCAPCDGVSSFQNEAGQTQCKSVTQCTAVQYELQGPTFTSNRMCGTCVVASTCGAGTALQGTCSGSLSPGSSPNCSVCSNTAGQYQDQAAQTSCKTLQVCSATEYQSQAPTVSSNRVCLPCTLASSCATSTFLNGTCTLTNNPQCVSCASVGGFQDEAGQTSCKIINPCPAWQYESRLPTASSARVCTNCTLASTCAPGTSLTGLCSGPSLPPQNPTCTTCAGNSFQPQGGQTACIPARVCAAFEYEVRALTATTDRQCANCTTRLQCSAGQYLRDTCSGSRLPAVNPVCVSCTAGTFSASAGQTACATAVVCGMTQYTVTPSTLSSDTICRNCTTASACGAGQRLSGVCSGPSVPGTTPSCVACDAAAGAYQDETGKTVCKAVRECATGFYVLTQATASSNAICDNCTTASACLVGQRLSGVCSGSAVPASNPSCVACNVAAGQFQDEAGKATCKAVQQCESNFYETAAATSSSDKVCSPCTTAGACLVGQRLSGVCSGSAVPASTPACMTCNATLLQFQDEAGKHFCKTAQFCSSTQYTTALPTSTSSFQCAACLTPAGCGVGQQLEGTCSGAAFVGTSPVCVTCPTGTYQDEAGQAVCKPVSVCPTGAYVSQNATTSSDALCSACDMACAQCTGPTRSDCQACNDKSFLFDTICNSTCPLGYFQSNSTRRCLPCAQPTCNLSQGLYLQVCLGSVDSFCANCSTCPGQTVAQPCSATADAICILISDSSRALAATAGISAGAAAGGVLLLLLLVILVVLFKRRRSKAQSHPAPMTGFTSPLYLDVASHDSGDYTQLNRSDNAMWRSSQGVDMAGNPVFGNPLFQFQQGEVEHNQVDQLDSSYNHLPSSDQASRDRAYSVLVRTDGSRAPASSDASVPTYAVVKKKLIAGPDGLSVSSPLYALGSSTDDALYADPPVSGSEALYAYNPVYHQGQSAEEGLYSDPTFVSRDGSVLVVPMEGQARYLDPSTGDGYLACSPEAADGGYLSPAQAKGRSDADGGYLDPARALPHSETDGGYLDPAHVEVCDSADGGYLHPAHLNSAQDQPLADAE